MNASADPILRKKVRNLTAICLVVWVGVTLLPVFLARTELRLGPWPLDFWMAAQGCVLAYLLIVCVYAWLVNRWERQAGSLSFEVPPAQDV
jgi:putative solute:sodium symporter small subunit